MKVLILCIDRDDDLGRKASVKGPVVGKKDVLNSAVKLALEDPSETDANAIFAGLKLFKDIEDAEEIAVLTGSVRVGYESDARIKKQIEAVQKKVKADGAILVSDGQEDEMILPVLESVLPILSVHRIAVHSGEELKGAYYTLASFLGRAKEDKGLARAIFGIPGIVALVYALFGGQGWRLLAGFLSGWFIVKGFQMEDSFAAFLKYVKESFINLSISFFLYLTSLVIGFIGAVKTSLLTADTPLKLAAKISISTAPLFFYSILALLLGLAIDSLPDKHRAYGFISAGVGLGVVVLVMRSLGSWILDATYPLSFVVTTSLLGLFVITAVKASAKLIK